jgi:hypothetical protein
VSGMERGVVRHRIRSAGVWSLVLALGSALACAAAAPVQTGASTARLLSFDNNRIDGTIAFPSSHHESVVRFELPPGKHHLTRLWLRVTAPGALYWFFYDQTPLEGPGEILDQGQLTIPPGQSSDGKDDRWWFVDLSALPPRTGVLWLGLKRAEGNPTIAACRVDSGQYFLRDDDPQAPINLSPVKRTPLVRLEISP